MRASCTDSQREPSTSSTTRHHVSSDAWELTLSRHQSWLLSRPPSSRDTAALDRVQGDFSGPVGAWPLAASGPSGEASSCEGWDWSWWSRRHAPRAAASWKGLPQGGSMSAAAQAGSSDAHRLADASRASGCLPLLGAPPLVVAGKAAAARTSALGKLQQRHRRCSVVRTCGAVFHEQGIPHAAHWPPHLGRQPPPPAPTEPASARSACRPSPIGAPAARAWIACCWRPQLPDPASIVVHTTTKAHSLPDVVGRVVGRIVGQGGHLTRRAAAGAWARTGTALPAPGWSAGAPAGGPGRGRGPRLRARPEGPCTGPPAGPASTCASPPACGAGWQA